MDAKTLEKQLITLEDLSVIREGYDIPSNVILSASASHETSRDHRPGQLCFNECMLGARVQVPFNFGLAEGLLAFNVSPARIVPHSWKTIRTMAWYCERRGCSADRYLWRELLICRSVQGYVVFLTFGDVKAIDNPPDHVSGWESRFFLARLSSERDTWVVLDQWEEPLPDPIPQSRASLSASQWWALMYFRGIVLRWHPLREEFFHLCKSVGFIVTEEEEKRAPKGARPSEEGSISVDSDSFIEEASRPPPSIESPTAVEHVDRRGVPSPRELVI
ncbi:hypothetical protein ACLOJK_023948 [Asimina triloba]